MLAQGSDTAVGVLLGGLIGLAGSVIVERSRCKRDEKREFISALKSYYANVCCAYYAWKERVGLEKRHAAALRTEDQEPLQRATDRVKDKYDAYYKEFLAEGAALSRYGNKQTRELLQKLENHWKKKDVDPDDAAYASELDRLLDELRDTAA